MTIATDRQIAYIESLVAKRDFPAAATLDVKALTKDQASNWISKLVRAPFKPVATPVAAGVAGPHPLDDIEVSAYAVPTAGLQIPGHVFRGDLAFFEVRMYKGHKFLNILTGAPGDFNRTRVRAPGALSGLAAVIGGRHVEYARLFGEHFTCCGRCKAPLTDQRSRELFLGPDCRKLWGL